MSVDIIREQLRRRAVLLEIGGFRPPDNPTGSWFGRVNFGLPDEAWPMMNDSPMRALCQINLTEMPFRPPRLQDIEFIAIFIGPEELPLDAPNGENWCLRAYKELTQLTPLAQVDTGSPIKPFPMRAHLVEEDYPCWEDVPLEVPEEVEGRYYDLFENVWGFKLGGWPSLVQSEIFWASGNKHSIDPEYVFQIDTIEKANWMWGDNGVGYFGRGTKEGHTDEWALAWQCY
jgi:hypothetical protein